MAKIVAVTNQKGGVGKTTVSFNLGLGLAKRGHKVLLIDNDPQGNLTTSVLDDPESLQADLLDIYKEDFSVEPQQINKNLHLIGANIKLSEVADNVNPYLPLLLKSYLRGEDRGEDLGIEDPGTEERNPVADKYDFAIIDCLPSFGPLNVAALIAADFVLVPTKPAPYAIAGLMDLFKNIVKMRKRGLNSSLKVAGIILNLVEGTRIHIQTEADLREKYEALVFENVINKGTKLEESPYYGESVMEYAPKTKQAKQSNSVIREFLRRVQ